MLARRHVVVGTALGLVYVLWGSTYLGIALALESMPPLAMAAARFLLAGAVLYAVASRFGDRVRDRPTRRQWGWAFLTGTPLLVLGNGGVVWAQQTVPSGIAALIIATIALWIVVLDRIVYGRRLGAIALTGIALGFGGVALLVNPLAGGELDRLGAALLVLAALGWAIGSLLSRGAAMPARPLVGASMQMLAGGAVMAVVAVAAGELGAIHPGEWTARSLAGFGFLVLFGSIVAFSAYVWLLKATRTSLVATYAYVNPIVAVLLGWAVLGENVSGRTLLAGGIILAGVALIVSGGRRAAEPQARRQPPRVAAASASATNAASSGTTRGSIACGSGASR